LPDVAPTPEETPGGADENSGAGGNADYVVEIDSEALAAIGLRLQRQAEELRQATQQPLDSAIAALRQQADSVASISRDVLASVEASALKEIDKSFKARQFKLELPPIEFPALEVLRANLARLARSFDFEAFKRAWDRGRPPNWRDLGDDVDLLKLIDITEAGLPTAWVPRASVLQELLGTPGPARAAVFGARRQEVIEDCRTVLGDVTSPELSDFVELLIEALDSANDGRLASAQALAASIFDTALRKTLPQDSGRYYSKVKTQIREQHENAPIAEMRWGFVHLPACVVLEDFWEYKGHPVPPQFNRHASAHAVGRTQYTPANATIALALATTLVREAHEGIVEAAEAVA
jgi:hypothetical protein